MFCMLLFNFVNYVFLLCLYILIVSFFVFLLLCMFYSVYSVLLCYNVYYVQMCTVLLPPGVNPIAVN